MIVALARGSCIVLIATAIVAAAPAQEATRRAQRVDRLRLDDAWPSTEDERVELFLRALTPSGAPARELTPADILLREDDRRIGADDVEVISLEESRRGVACVLVLDTSPTMQEPLPEMKRAAREFLERIGDWDRLAIVSVAGSVEEVSPFSANRAEALRAIDGIEAHLEPNPTLIYDGIHRAVEMLRNEPSLPRRGVVIVFSDGSDGGSEHSLDEVIERAKPGDGVGQVLVYAIGYQTGFGDSGLAGLRRLAQGTTASYWEANPGLPVTDFYADIWQQLMRSYVVRFRTDLDGESHALSIVAGSGEAGLTLRYPEVGSGLARWLAAGAGALALGGGAVALQRTRRTGRLVQRSGNERGRTVRLRRGLNRIGQAADNEVVLTHDTISRRHAEIEVSRGAARLRDLDSTNGTFVNDVPVEGARLLAPGDRLRLADVELVYER